jgi:hypothetical protein
VETTVCAVLGALETTFCAVDVTVCTGDAEDPSPELVGCELELVVVAAPVDPPEPPDPAGLAAVEPPEELGVEELDPGGGVDGGVWPDAGGEP